MPFSHPASADVPAGFSNERIGLPDCYRLLLRLLVAGPMYFYQAQAQAAAAWHFIWEDKPWPLLTAMQAMNLPQPSVTAVSLVFVLVFSPFGLFLGFLTRINALLTFLATGFFFLSGLPLSDYLSGQTYVLFLGLCAALVLSGAGAFSCDAAFAYLRRRRKWLKSAGF